MNNRQRDNLSRLLENQEKHLGSLEREDFIMPPPLRVSEERTCEFCTNYVPLGNNLKKFGCSVWNYRPYGKDFSCEFHDPMMIDGMTQRMMNRVRKLYPKFIGRPNDVFFIKPVEMMIIMTPMPE